MSFTSAVTLEIPSILPLRCHPEVANFHYRYILNLISDLDDQINILCQEYLRSYCDSRMFEINLLKRKSKSCL